MKFVKWLNVFLEEKEIDQEEILEIDNKGDFHLVPVGVIVELVEMADPETQSEIKNKLVEIDFKNGDVKDFLKYLFIMFT